MKRSYYRISEANWHQITAYYFAYFHNWSMYNNYEFVKNKYEFMTCPQGRPQELSPTLIVSMIKLMIFIIIYNMLSSDLGGASETPCE